MEAFLSSSLIFCRIDMAVGVSPWTHKVSGFTLIFGAVVGDHIPFPDHGQRLPGGLFGIVDDGAGDLSRLKGAVGIVNPVRVDFFHEPDPDLLRRLHHDRSGKGYEDDVFAEPGGRPAMALETSRSTKARLPKAP